MPTEVPGAKSSANGELINRVQQLRLDGQLGRGPGTSRGSWLPWVLCGMMAIAWAGVGVRWYKTPEASSDSGEAAKASSNGVAAANPQAGNQPTAPAGALLLQIKGTLTPFLQINLSPDDVAGVVTHIYFKEGDRVKKGYLLAKIRNNRYLNDYEGAKAALDSAQCRWDEMHPDSVRTIEKEQARAELAEAEANQVRAKQDLERYTSSKASTVVSPQDIDKAVADMRAAEFRVLRLKNALAILIEGPRPEKLLGAKADVQNAKSRLEECDRLLKNCEVKAPIDGTILTKVADPGVVVSPMSFNVASGICSMADLSDLEAEIDVREDQITAIKTGQECQVAAMADPNRVYKGRVDRIMPIADDNKNTIKVRVKVLLSPGEEPGSFLKPKMSTVVRVYNTIIPEFAAGKK
ncbi:MAG TPA: efflux RND transporter periplasmic adaptor subunit [Gemmata sp.]|nr:efflux RND transporter periplasmic adaptor subunit [Gemmata sp.]